MSKVQFTPDRATGGYVGHTKDSNGNNVEINMVPDPVYGGFKVYTEQVRAYKLTHEESGILWKIAFLIFCGTPPICLYSVISRIVRIFKKRFGILDFFVLIHGLFGVAAMIIGILAVINSNKCGISFSDSLNQLLGISK